MSNHLQVKSKKSTIISIDYDCVYSKDSWIQNNYEERLKDVNLFTQRLNTIDGHLLIGCCFGCYFG